MKNAPKRLLKTAVCTYIHTMVQEIRPSLQYFDFFLSYISLKWAIMNISPISDIIIGHNISNCRSDTVSVALHPAAMLCCDVNQASHVQHLVFWWTWGLSACALCQHTSRHPPRAAICLASPLALLPSRRRSSPLQPFYDVRFASARPVSTPCLSLHLLAMLMSVFVCVDS